MAKITINPIVGSYASVIAVNDRLQQIEDTLNDNILWRDGFVAEPNSMDNDLDMAGNSILNSDVIYTEDKYLGAEATAPTEADVGIPLSAAHTGWLYFNTTSNDMWVWNGTAWGLIGTTQNSAASVTLADSGGNYTAVEVESAFAELASTANGEGASIIGVEDSAGLLTATDVEAAIAELAGPRIKFLGTFDPVGLSEIYITGIPANANRVIVQVSGLSAAGGGGSFLAMQLANTSVVNQVGASGTVSYVQTAGQATSLYPGAAYYISNLVPTSSLNGMNGEFTLTKQDSADVWWLTGQVAELSGPSTIFTAGGGSASAVVDSLKIYMTNPADLFLSPTKFHVYYES